MADKLFDRLERWYQNEGGREKVAVALLHIVRAVLLVALLAIFFVVAGCKSQKPTISSSTTTQQTLVSERYDSAHTVAGDSAAAALLFRCDSLGNVYLANLQTEQGKRLRLELQLKGLQKHLADVAENAPTEPIYINTPMLVEVDCKEDSFGVVIRGLRERVAYYEEREKETKEPIRYIPKFYKNCTIGFFSLLILLLIAAALLIWKNWSKVAAWAIKIYAKMKWL